MRRLFAIAASLCCGAAFAASITVVVPSGTRVETLERKAGKTGPVTVLIDQGTTVDVQTAPSPTPAPPPPSTTADADFAARCSAPGVVRCFNFDEVGQLQKRVGTLLAWGYSPGEKGGPYIDAAVKASGGGSLRFDLVPFVANGGNQAGAWWGNFSDDGSLQFTDGQEFYVQWRQRFSQAMIDTVFFEDGLMASSAREWKRMDDASGNPLPPTFVTPTTVSIPSTSAWQAWQGWGIRFHDAAGNFIGYGVVPLGAAGAVIKGAATEISFVLTQGTTSGAVAVARGMPQGGIKQMNVVVGDGFAGRSWGTCEGNEIPITTDGQFRVPIAYNACGRFLSLMALGKAQNGPTLNCDGVHPGTVQPDGKFAVSPGCVAWVANEWMTFQVRVKVGTYDPTTQRSMASEYQLWIARQGHPSVLVIDWRPGVPGYQPLFTGDNGGGNAGNLPYGKVNIFPWMTSKDGTQPHPLAQTWYDELIVSRSKIADPQ